MKNKIVGYLVIMIALIMGVIIYSYHNFALGLAQESCSIEGPSCPHLQESHQQLLINGMLLAFIAGIGVYLIFFSHEERIVTKFKTIKEQIQPNKISKDNYKKIISELDDDEKKVFEIILNSQGSVFQSELVSKTGLTKVKVTRILDRLEGKGLIERKRRGMTNVVVLKH